MPFTTYKFGDYELHCARFELRRNGEVVKLERIPMELLIFLAEKEGDIASRQEIVERLWGKDVFVDTEHGINTAIRKIRTALREDAEKPRFVHTVLGKGYRFVPGTGKGQRPLESESGSQTPVEPRVVEFPNASQEATSRLSRKVSAKWLAAAAALVLFVATVGFWFVRRRDQPTATIQSIAVLPLANLSGDASQDYFADGMTDELITMLARNTSLHVVSRTSVMQYKGIGRPMRDIARELGADAILEGSISRTSSRVHLNLQLINARGDTHIWADSYDRDANEIYSLPSELAYTIAKKLKTDRTPAKRQRYVSPQAHDAYLRGRFFWFGEDYVRSLDYMKKAIDLQPDYAAAWSGLADDYAVIAVANQAPAQEMMPKAFEAAQKALELDDSVAETHNTIAALHMFYDWDWKAADEESKRAIELNPDFAEVHHLRAYLLSALDRHEEAIQEQKRASEMDPFARPFAMGFVLLLSRKFDDALQELESRKKDLPGDFFVRMSLSDAYRYKGREADAAREFSEAVHMQGDEEFVNGFQRAFDRGGFKAVAEWRIKRRSDPNVSKLYLSPLMLARWYAQAGDKDEAIEALYRAYNERTPFLIFVQCSPDFDFLHSDARYRTLVQKIGLPPAY